MQTAIQTMIPYCILNVFRSKRAEKTLDSLDWHNASSGYGINAHLIEGVNSNTVADGCHRD